MTCSIRSASIIAESKPDPSMPGSKNELRVVMINEKDVIEAYLTTFEHLMTAYGVAKSNRSLSLHRGKPNSHTP